MFKRVSNLIKRAVARTVSGLTGEKKNEGPRRQAARSKVRQPFNGSNRASRRAERSYRFRHRSRCRPIMARVRVGERKDGGPLFSLKPVLWLRRKESTRRTDRERLSIIRNYLRMRRVERNAAKLDGRRDRRILARVARRAAAFGEGMLRMADQATDAAESFKRMGQPMSEREAA